MGASFLMSSCEVKDGPATDMVVRGFLDGSVEGEDGRLEGVVIETRVGRKSRRVDATGEGAKLDLYRCINVGSPDAFHRITPFFLVLVPPAAHSPKPSLLYIKMADFKLPNIVDNEDGSWGPSTFHTPGAFKECVPSFASASSASLG